MGWQANCSRTSVLICFFEIRLFADLFSWLCVQGGEQHVLSKGTAGSRKKDTKLAKEGVSIGGQYVVVTVDEIKKPTHQLVFKTYDIDSTERASCAVPFSQISKLSEYQEFKGSNLREQLATALLPRLSFDDGVLVFNGAQNFSATDEIQSSAQVCCGHLSTKPALGLYHCQW